MKTITLISLCLFILAPLTAQPQFCEPDQRTRVLMIGDSWTVRMHGYDSLNQVFLAADRADLHATGEHTAFFGARSDQWVQPENLAVIEAQVLANSDLKVVQIMLGANEMLGGTTYGGWHTGLSDAEQFQLMLGIGQNIHRALRPGIPVLVAFYDFMALEDVMRDPFGLEIWDPVMASLGRPSTEAYNLAWLEMEAVVSDHLADIEGLETISYWGLAQNKFGFPDEGIAPGDIALPGDVTRSSPAVAMGFDGIDALHLSETGYRHVAQYLWDNYYRDALCISQDEFSQAVRECARGGGNPSILIRWMNKHRCR